MTDILLMSFTAVLAYVGFQQLHTIRMQTKQALFDKRFKTYQATIKFLNVAISHEITPQAIDEFKLNTQEMPFLFDDELNQYREKILKKVCGIKFILTRQEQLPSFKADNLYELDVWVGDQLEKENCTKMFSKELSFKNWNPEPEKALCVRFNSLKSKYLPKKESTKLE